VVSTATGSAGILGLHAGQDKALMIGKIDLRVRQHCICPFFQKQPESIMLKSRVARLGGFGNVHCQ
jgi:hypothetical protein